MINILEPSDCPKRRYFCETVLAEKDNDENIAQCLAYSDKATLYTRVKVNRHNLPVQGTEYYATLQYKNDSVKVNVYCAVSLSQVYGPSVFAENNDNGIN
jgi:hypothetical protein